MIGSLSSGNLIPWGETHAWKQLTTGGTQPQSAGLGRLPGANRPGQHEEEAVLAHLRPGPFLAAMVSGCLMPGGSRLQPAHERAGLAPVALDSGKQVIAGQ